MHCNYDTVLMDEEMWGQIVNILIDNNNKFYFHLMF